MSDRLTHLRDQADAMVDDLAALVSYESPTGSDMSACASAISELFSRRLGSAPSPVIVDGVTHLWWTGGGPTKVALIGHYDTVWPLGTLARWPFSVSDGRATGPGAFDMKAGIVQLVCALATLPQHDGVTVLLTADEESGSFSSRELIEETARGAVAALVLEPSAGGSLKKARKGTGMYTLSVAGKAAHAGLEPEKGINALMALASALLDIPSIEKPTAGTTVTPTMANAGSATNVVPAAATAEIDVRVWLPEEAARVDAAIRGLTTNVPGAVLTVTGGPNRPPMQPNEWLTTRASDCVSRLGLAPVSAIAVGGGSDGNFTAAIGTPTLDGLGAVGDGAHAEGEYVELATMPERAALVAELVADLLTVG
jgi:glutamate carboxypeptidase